MSYNIFYLIRYAKAFSNDYDANIIFPIVILCVYTNTTNKETYYKINARAKRYHVVRSVHHPCKTL